MVMQPQTLPVNKFLRCEGYWGNGPIPDGTDPNGYHTAYKLWRLVVRVVGIEGTSVLVRVGIRKEEGRLHSAELPESGLSVYLFLRQSLSGRILTTTGITLTQSEPVASATLPFQSLATVAIAELVGSYDSPVLSAYTMLNPEPLEGLRQCGHLVHLVTRPEANLDSSLAISCNIVKPLDCLQVVIPTPVPPNEEDIEHHDLSYFNSTGASLWDCAIILASALPELLRSMGQLDLLEIGCGIGLSGITAALLGHRCVATDMQAAVDMAVTAGYMNCSALERSSGSWRTQVMDWTDPPQWALEQQWDILLGADLMHDSSDLDEQLGGRVWACSESWSECRRSHTAFFSLLSRLRFGEFLLAERERHHRTTAAFFNDLHRHGFEFARVELQDNNVYQARAADVVVWRIRHKCLVDVPAHLQDRDCVSMADNVFHFPLRNGGIVHVCQDSQSDEVGAVVWDAAIVLAIFLEQERWLCEDSWLLELGCGTGFLGLVASTYGARGSVLTDTEYFMPMLKRSISLNQGVDRAGAFANISARTLDWTDASALDGLPGLHCPDLLVIGADIVYPGGDTLHGRDNTPLLDMIQRLCECRSPMATRCVLAHTNRTDNIDKFNEDARSRGFAVQVVARHRRDSTGISVYTLDWHIPFVKCSAHRHHVRLRAQLFPEWLGGSLLPDVLCSDMQVQLSWPRFGWKDRIRFPVLVGTEGTCKMCRSKRTLEIIMDRKEKEEWLQEKQGNRKNLQLQFDGHGAKANLLEFELQKKEQEKRAKSVELELLQVKRELQEQTERLHEEQEKKTQHERELLQLQRRNELELRQLQRKLQETEDRLQEEEEVNRKSSEQELRQLQLKLQEKDDRLREERAKREKLNLELKQLHLQLDGHGANAKLLQSEQQKKEEMLREELEKLKRLEQEHLQTIIKLDRERGRKVSQLQEKEAELECTKGTLDRARKAEDEKSKLIKQLQRQLDAYDRERAR